MNIDKDSLLSSLGEGGRAMKKITVPHFWRGGTQGAEREWDEPMNWHNRRVPQWFDIAIIGGAYTFSGFFPIINDLVSDITQLRVLEDGQLWLSDRGKLSIDVYLKPQAGIFNGGLIFNEGELTLRRTGVVSIVNSGIFFNKGEVILEKREENSIRQIGNGKFNNSGYILFV